MEFQEFQDLLEQLAFLVSQDHLDQLDYLDSQVDQDVLEHPVSMYYILKISLKLLCIKLLISPSAFALSTLTCQRLMGEDSGYNIIETI